MKDLLLGLRPVLGISSYVLYLGKAFTFVLSVCTDVRCCPYPVTCP
jgi:hypothetical protein